MISFSRVLAAAPDPGGQAIDGKSGAILVVGALVAVALSIAVFFGRGRKRRVTMEQALGADVGIGLRLLRDQLAGIDADASRAAADAWNRLGAAEAIAANGHTVGLLRAMRHTLLEGLAAAQVARADAGLETGPVPPPPSEAPMTPHPAEVLVDGGRWPVLPSYRPGFVHHFPGGVVDKQVIPGGWYEQPFWERLLLPGD